MDHKTCGIYNREKERWYLCWPAEVMREMWVRSAQFSTLWCDVMTPERLWECQCKRREEKRGEESADCWRGRERWRARKYFLHSKINTFLTSKTCLKLNTFLPIWIYFSIHLIESTCFFNIMIILIHFYNYII